MADRLQCADMPRRPPRRRAPGLLPPVTLLRSAPRPGASSRLCLRRRPPAAPVPAAGANTASPDEQHLPRPRESSAWLQSSVARIAPCCGLCARRAGPASAVGSCRPARVRIRLGGQRARPRASQSPAPARAPVQPRADAGDRGAFCGVRPNAGLARSARSFRETAGDRREPLQLLGAAGAPWVRAPPASAPASPSPPPAAAQRLAAGGPESKVRGTPPAAPRDSAATAFDQVLRGWGCEIRFAVERENVVNSINVTKVLGGLKLDGKIVHQGPRCAGTLRE